MSLSKRIVLSGAVVSAAAFFLVNLAAPAARGQTYHEKVLHSFTGSPDGTYPSAGLVGDSAGNLYGTTSEGGAYGGGTVFKVTAPGVESVLYSFTGGADGANPGAGLIRDSAGNLYGTTIYGGASGEGTVFKVTASGAESVLYSFTGGADGSDPVAGLVRDSAGNLYGTTEYGGAYRQGTVFQVSASGVESVLYSFCPQSFCADGEYPVAGLVRDSAGNLYGTTNYGGAYSAGTVFEVSASGSESVLYSFSGVNGGYPLAGLVRDTAGNLYGTTIGGGTGEGTVFEVSAGGAESVLYRFVGGTDGDDPAAGLVRDSAGNLYGTTLGGGLPNAGTVFEVSAGGVESVLHSFCSQSHEERANGLRSGCADGKYPYAGLIRDAVGKLYGTTYQGGASGYGTVFDLIPLR